MIAASYENAQARIAELEHQVATLTGTRVASLEKDTEGLVKALRGRTARISARTEHGHCGRTDGARS